MKLRWGSSAWRRGETLFIDDLQPNVDAALEVGLRAIRYDYRRHVDFVARLNEMGVAALG